MARHKICAIGGDGIGPELLAHALRVLEGLGVEAEIIEAEAGYACYKSCGTSIPRDTIELARSCDAVLFGAVTTPPNIPDYRSAIVTLRQELDLYANVRPVRAYAGVPSIRPDIDFAIVRENTEGMYAGREERKGDVATAMRVITRRASERIARFAYEYALAHGRRKVTIVHKANILRETCGLFRETALGVAAAYAQVETEEALVDAMAMRLIKQPQDFGVILTTNLFGDILSDEAAQLVGGLGMVPSANIGGRNALFEPAHGSAPKYAGRNVANPCAMLLSLHMLLEHVGEERAAARLQSAIMRTLADGRHITPDIGGSSGTDELVAAVMRAAEAQAAV